MPERPEYPRFQAIGTLSTPWRTIAECPRNGRQPDPAPPCHADITAPFISGWKALDGFCHLMLIYWLDQAPPPKLTFTPPFDTESGGVSDTTESRVVSDAGSRGVFATRAPWRPNPIGLSVVAFDGFAAPGRLRLRYLDCVDGTPLLDIKPYLPSTDSEPDATMGWLAPHATRRI